LSIKSNNNTISEFSRSLPELLLRPLEKGGTAGIVPDMPTLLAGAYEEFGWDAETGRPAYLWQVAARPPRRWSDEQMSDESDGRPPRAQAQRVLHRL